MFGANDAAVVRIQGGRALPGSPRPATRVFPIRSDRGHHPNFEFAAEAAYPGLAADVQLAFANREPVEREFDGPDGRRLTARITPWSLPERGLDAVIVVVGAAAADRIMERELRAAETRRRLTARGLLPRRRVAARAGGGAR